MPGSFLPRTAGAIALVLVAGTIALAGSHHPSKAKTSFRINGMYVEGCSCSAPCACELTGPNMSCEGVGAFSLTSGTLGGKSLDGVRTAYAVAPGKWVRIYIDAPASKRKAAEAFMRGALTGFGPVEAVKNAKVAITGTNGTYKATVDGGKVMTLSTKPMLGGDNKTPLIYSNVHDIVHPTVMQATTTSGTFKDGGHEFTLKDSNAFFNQHLKTVGSM